MANILYDTDAGDWNTGTQWVGDAEPGALDNAWFDNNSANCTLDANVTGIAGLDMSQGTGYGGTLAVDGFGIVVTGAGILDGTITGSGGGGISLTGDLTKSSGMTLAAETVFIFPGGFGDITTNSIPGGKVDIQGINPVGYIDKALWQEFLIQSGTLETNGQDMDVVSDIQYMGGTVTFSGGETWTQTGAGDINWNAPGSIVPKFKLAQGGNSAQTGHIYCGALELGNADLTGTTFDIIITPTAADFWVQGSGDYTCNDLLFTPGVASLENTSLLDITLTSGGTPQARVNPSDSGNLCFKSDFKVGAAANFQMDFNVAFTVFFEVRGDLLAGAVNLGRAESQSYDADFRLTGAGFVNIASLQQIGTAGGSRGDRMSLGSKIYTVSGTFDGMALGSQPIVFTNTSARFTGGTIQNVSLAGQPTLIARTTDGNDAGSGGNTNVRFTTEHATGTTTGTSMAA